MNGVASIHTRAIHRVPSHLCVLGDVAHDGEEVRRGHPELPEDPLLKLLQPILPPGDGDDKHALRGHKDHEDSDEFVRCFSWRNGMGIP